MELDLTIKKISEEETKKMSSRSVFRSALNQFEYIGKYHGDRQCWIVLFERWTQDGERLLFLQIGDEFYSITRDVFDLINSFSANSNELMKREIARKIGL